MQPSTFARFVLAFTSSIVFVIVVAPATALAGKEGVNLAADGQPCEERNGSSAEHESASGLLGVNAEPCRMGQRVEGNRCERACEAGGDGERQDCTVACSEPVAE